MATWADLHEGDRIYDAMNRMWTVVSEPHVNAGHSVAANISDGNRTVTVYQPFDHPVVMATPEMDSAVRRVEKGLGGEVFGVQPKTTANVMVEASKPEGLPVPLPRITRPLELRGHLYLVHDLTAVAHVDTAEELFRLHDAAHEEPLSHPHTHKE